MVCQWTLTDPEFGRPHKTRFKLTADEAFAVDPFARPVPGTEEVRMMWADRAAGMQALSTSPLPTAPR